MSQNICPVHLIRVVGAALSAARRLIQTSLQKATREKLLRKKKNESWAMRRFENIRRLTSPTLGVGGNLLCKIVQSGFFRSRYSRSRPSFVTRRKRRRLLRRLKRRWSQSSSQRRVSIFRWINRPQARA